MSILGLGPERFPTSLISLPDLCSLGGGCCFEIFSNNQLTIWDVVANWLVVAVLIVSQTIDYLGGSCCFGFVLINN